LGGAKYAGCGARHCLRAGLRVPKSEVLDQNVEALVHRASAGGPGLLELLLAERMKKVLVPELVLNSYKW
jgi:hypothetical protein